MASDIAPWADQRATFQMQLDRALQAVLTMMHAEVATMFCPAAAVRGPHAGADQLAAPDAAAAPEAGGAAAGICRGVQRHCQQRLRQHEHGVAPAPGRLHLLAGASMCTSFFAPRFTVWSQQTKT
jgi:hypothetical protein